ncbi:UbiA family prenyltransferase, partial [Henriciella sp.]|uniref:UbiA family prenyltransferase n=1 Tax=Henriciella sp. TaxID=1968823 RepID=UPI0025BC551E
WNHFLKFRSGTPKQQKDQRPLDAWLLFAIIFFWTPPHFWALSLLAHGEYKKANVPMLPVTHGAKVTRNQILIYTLLLAPLALAPVLTGLGGVIYAATATLLGGVFVKLAVDVWRSDAGAVPVRPESAKAAKRLFAFSILYLFLLFAALMIEHGAGAHFDLAGIL